MAFITHLLTTLFRCPVFNATFHALRDLLHGANSVKYDSQLDQKVRHISRMIRLDVDSLPLDRLGTSADASSAGELSAHSLGHVSLRLRAC